VADCASSSCRVWSPIFSDAKVLTCVPASMDGFAGAQSWIVVGHRRMTLCSWKECYLLFVERMLSVACKRLVTIGDDAPLIDAAKLPGILPTDLLVVCCCDEMLAGIITKTDVARQISLCQGSGCTTASS
jgi:hypothetical protein